ncbi:hypothetical protein C7451_11014 [Blastomonas natatoria]|uniref:Uncharacterized protein n=1 Tax=Blastomonas natatoria TaxID=34015 RepID=A0A2V3UVR8_9SPHN|nr:hypothetical protein C7451_11014 [Blastomonas natatoria]
MGVTSGHATRKGEVTACKARARKGTSVPGGPDTLVAGSATLQGWYQSSILRRNVSGRKIRPMTTVAAATRTGYHRP